MKLPAPLSSVLILGLLATSGSAQLDQTEPLDDDPARRFGADIWERMQAVDPARDPWSGEALWPSLQAALNGAVELLVGNPEGGGAAGDLNVQLPAFESGVLLRDGDTFRVRRFESGYDSGPAPQSLERLGARLGDPAERHAGWKVVGLSRFEDEHGSFSLRLLYHAHGTRTDAAGDTRRVEHHAEARLTGVTGTDGVPLPDTLLFSALTEIEGPRQGGSLLVDATRSAFADDPEFTRQFGPGMDHWRSQLANGLGLPLLGHPAGLAVGDVDGDLLDDLYVCQPGGLPNRVFLANGDGTFRPGNAGEAALLDVSRSALLIELDGDGDVDLVVSVLDELLFFSNDGGGRFRFEAKAPGGGTTSLAVADVDQDGDLDLFAAAYASPYDGGVIPTPYHDATNGAINRLYVNLGDWRFSDVAGDVGFLEAPPRFSFAAAFQDYDGDGDADLYVANDFGRNELWRNDLIEDQIGEGVLVRRRRFVNVAAKLGVEDLSAGMGVSWGDVDEDGVPDLYVSNMYSAAGNRVAYQRSFHEEADEDTRLEFQRHAHGNSLFLNRVAEGAGFVDVSAESGTSMGRWAWGSIHVDLDLDGRLDLLVPNGFLTHKRGDDL